MMVDWLIVWGVAEAAGIVVKPILEDLVKDAAKDYTKDFFKDCLKQVIHLPEQDVQKEAYGKALKEFLELVEAELVEAGYQPAQVKPFIQPLKQFIAQANVAALLGQAFAADCRSLDTQQLAQTWQGLEAPSLPPDFDWDLVGKLYLRKVKAIVQKTDALRLVFSAEAQAAAAASLQELAGIAPEFDLGRYAEGLREAYGQVKLESLDTTGVYYNELKLWKIFVPQMVRECQEFLPQVYELPKEQLRRLRDQGDLDEAVVAEALERHRQAYGAQPLQSVLAVVGDPTGPVGTHRPAPLPHVVILGDPGSGKSTLLQYLALVWAERPRSELPLHPLPLLIELRTYARDKQEKKCHDLLSFIHGGNVTCRLNQQQLHDRLKQGQAIALLDGVDEVFDPHLREEIVTDIHRFTNDYPQVQAIVTSRWLGYKAQRLRDAGFRHFMLQDLEPAQIQDFIQRWHDLTFTEGADKLRKRERLQKAIQDSHAIRELAGNPLLLTMMAILNRNQELPRDRPELYNQASRVLLHQWDVERALVEDQRLDPKTIDYRDKQAMLRQVAHHMQSSSQGLAGNLISAADLETILADYLKSIEVQQPRTMARVMINQLRSRNFILCYLGADSYAFVHRTFLEYFCAWEIVWRFKETQTLTIDDLIATVFGQHWQEETWQEVMCLIAGMIDAKFVGDIITYLLAQTIDQSAFLDGERRRKEGLSNLLLAADCLAEVRNQSVISAVSAQLLKTLQQEVQQEYPYRLSSEAAIALTSRIATLWHENPETLRWLKGCLQLDSESYVPESALQELARGWKDDPDTLPWLKTRAQSDDHWLVRQAAVQALARGWKDDPDTLPILKTRAQSDDAGFVRRSAVQELARGWKDDPDTLPWLKTRAQSNDDRNVRQAAVQELARGWKDDPDTLPWLKTRAQSDDDRFVRQAAVQELARGWKDDPDTLSILKTRAQSDDDSAVRQAALRELARGWKDDPDTLPILKTRAQSDDDRFVRQAAVQELARGWKDDPDTLPILKTRAQSDDDELVRRSAMQELARGWKDDPDTLPWLKTRAQSDDDRFVRQAAVQELARGWKDDPDTLPILKTRAQSDDDELVRRSAVQELARGWKDDPDTLPILKTRAQSDDDELVRRSAVQELARGWKDDPDTLPILKTRAQSDEDGDVRQAAVEELARGWQDDPDTLPILKTRAQSDEDGDVRQAAVQELARGWKDDPELVALFVDRALHDPFEREKEWQANPRQTALAVLVKNYPDHPQTLVVLQDRATQDPDEPVRAFAQQQLAQWQGGAGSADAGG